jgi:hypothetical protein
MPWYKRNREASNMASKLEWKPLFGIGVFIGMISTGIDLALDFAKLVDFSGFTWKSALVFAFTAGCNLVSNSRVNLRLSTIVTVGCNTVSTAMSS